MATKRTAKKPTKRTAKKRAAKKTAAPAKKPSIKTARAAAALLTAKEKLATAKDLRKRADKLIREAVALETAAALDDLKANATRIRRRPKPKASASIVDLAVDSAPVRYRVNGHAQMPARR